MSTFLYIGNYSLYVRASPLLHQVLFNASRQVIKCFMILSSHHRLLLLIVVVRCIIASVSVIIIIIKIIPIVIRRPTKL